MQNIKNRSLHVTELNPKEEAKSFICDDCGNLGSDYGKFGKICGWCMSWTYEIKNKNMEKFICTRTFVNDNTEFRRYYYGEEITEEEYFKLSGRDQGNFKRVLKDG